MNSFQTINATLDLINHLPQELREVFHVTAINKNTILLLVQIKEEV